MAEEAYQNKLSSEIEKQKVEAQSSGFIAQKENGKIVTPAATIQSLVSDVKNLGNNIIANANNPSEFLSGVVVAMVNRSVNTLIQKGVGDIQNNIRREIRSVDSQVAGTLNSAIRSSGPAAGIVDQALQQRTNVRVNTTTPPPPAPVTSADGLY